MGQKITRTKAVMTFFADIRRYPTMTPDNEVEMFNRLHNGDASARETIINSNLRFVASVAKMYCNSENFLDCVNEGTMGLIDAIDRYDSTRGNRFLSFAVSYIKLYIGRFVKNDKVVKSTLQNNLQYAISRQQRIFFQVEERYPTSDELYEILVGLGYKITKDACDLIFAKSISESCGGEDESTFEDSCEWNERTQSENDFVSITENDEIRNKIEKALKVLNEREAKIVKMHIYDDCDFDTIAERLSEEGKPICGERVRQIYKASLPKIGARI